MNFCFWFESNNSLLCEFLDGDLMFLDFILYMCKIVVFIVDKNVL